MIPRKVLVREGLLLAFLIAVVYVSPLAFGNGAPDSGAVALLVLAWVVVTALRLWFVSRRHRQV